MQEIYVQPHREEHPKFYRYLWSSVKRLLNWIGHDRLPEFARVAISVAKSAGQVSLQSEPYPIPAEGCGVMTVVSANLWHDWPRHRGLQKRLESFAQLVESEKADLVLLQEVARTKSFYADKWLGQRLQMAHVYTRANGSRKLGFEEGLGIFSRFPLKKLPFVRQMSQAHNPFSRRVALGVEVDTPCGAIMAFSVHLGLVRKENAKQLRELHGWVTEISSGRSAIIAGDFNTPEHTHQIKHVRSTWLDAFREIHEHGRAPTHEIKWPWGGAFLSHRLDYIFLQPGDPVWQVTDVKHLDAPDGPHSDHRAVLARFAPGHLASQDYPEPKQKS
ncbi:MAG: endonuclease/exonuclease/phosphatase family protein [Anaerolineales bacterium]|nr:endonuclease/exonuclease/phosphatase family protein [Anaerolineales bacterium]NTW12038.1 endonuclease/exonuclease/phosphatase family protein [Anaerolineales bacterium]